MTTIVHAHEPVETQPAATRASTGSTGGRELHGGIPVFHAILDSRGRAQVSDVVRKTWGLSTGDFLVLEISRGFDARRKGHPSNGRELQGGIPMFHAVLDSRGRIQVSETVRKSWGLEAGDFVILEIKRGFKTHLAPIPM